MVENIARTTKNNIEIWLLGNTLEEASTILKAFNFLPETFGRFYLKRKRAIIDNLEPTEEYLKDREGSVAQLLGGDNMSNYTNELTKDRKLICKDRLVRPTTIIKFSSNPSDWFVLWDGHIIRRFSGQSCTSCIAMRPYINEWFNKEKKQTIIDMYDAEAFRFSTLVDQTYFKDALSRVRAG